MSDETTPVDTLEEKKVTELRLAQNKAEALFYEVQARGFIRAGITESRLNQEIYDLAKVMFGISTYWHKRIVRAGANTLLPYADNPPDHTIGGDDILFLDLGPVFEEYEADFGRTFVVGSDPDASGTRLTEIIRPSAVRVLVGTDRCLLCSNHFPVYVTCHTLREPSSTTKKLPSLPTGRPRPGRLW